MLHHFLAMIICQDHPKEFCCENLKKTCKFRKRINSDTLGLVQTVLNDGSTANKNLPRKRINSDTPRLVQAALNDTSTANKNLPRKRINSDTPRLVQAALNDISTTNKNLPRKRINSETLRLVQTALNDGSTHSSPKRAGTDAGILHISIVEVVCHPVYGYITTHLYLVIEHCRHVQDRIMLVDFTLKYSTHFRIV